MATQYDFIILSQCQIKVGAADAVYMKPICEIVPQRGRDFLGCIQLLDAGVTVAHHSKLQPAATAVSNAVITATFLHHKEVIIILPCWVNAGQRFMGLCMSVKMLYESTDYPYSRCVLWCLKCVKSVSRTLLGELIMMLPQTL